MIWWSKLSHDFSCFWRAIIALVWCSVKLACSHHSCLLFTSLAFKRSLMVELKLLSSSLVDRRAAGPLTFCHFELVPVWPWEEEMSTSDTDMKSLAKEGKELADWWADCLCFALLVIMMEGDDEWGATTGEEDCGGGSPKLWWSSKVEGKAGGLDGFAAVVGWLGSSSRLAWLDVVMCCTLRAIGGLKHVGIFGMRSKVAS